MITDKITFNCINKNTFHITKYRSRYKIRLGHVKDKFLNVKRSISPLCCLTAYIICRSTFIVCNYLFVGKDIVISCKSP